jgi:hypothetical protein
LHLGVGGQWIKANVIGGIVNVVLAFLAFVLGRMLGVSDPDASGVVQTIYVVIATAALTLGVVALGYLMAVVLRTRLPAFPMRGWLALYLVTGVIFGLISSFSWIAPEAKADEGPYEFDLVVGLMFGAMIAGVVAGAALGALQALILRSAARGLGLWIVCCTLAGALFVIVIPVVLYGPQGGLAGEVAIEVAAFVVTILAAIILVPAVRRLRPR